nr:E3 ubiquitin-protein ligase TOM1-like [Rhipicephalus microplus]
MKRDEQTPVDDLQKDPQLTADEDEDDAEESKDAWSPGTVSSPSPGGETMYETQSEDDDDDKLKDDKSSIDDARTKTPETPSGTESDMKDDASQHMESGTEDGTGDLSKHLLGSVRNSVPNSPASVLQE